MDLEYQYLVAKLQQALASDPRVNMLDLKVRVTHGKVHVSGTVPTNERRTAVDAVISETMPGIAVRNELTVLQLGECEEHESIHD